MTITVGTPSNQAGNTLTSHSHTVAAGDDRVLVVGISWRAGGVGDVQYAGISMTEIFYHASIGSTDPGVGYYQLINPPVGTANITWTRLDVSTRFGVAAVVLYGVDQVTPSRTPDSINDLSGTQTASNVNPVSAVGDLVVDFLRLRPNADQTNFAADIGQTELVNALASNGAYGMSHKDGASSQTSMGWTWTEAAHVTQVAAAFIPVGGGAVVAELTNPTAASTGTGTATGNVTTNEASGTAYAVVTNSETPPSIADIKTGTGAEWSGSQVVSAAGELTFNATGLTGGFRWFHFVHTVDDDSQVATAGFVDPLPFTRTNKTLHIQSKIEGESLTTLHGIPFKTSVETGGYDFERGSKPITHEVVLRRAFIVVTANISTTDVLVKVIDDDIDTNVVITIPAGQTGTFRDDVNEHTFPSTTSGMLKLEAAESGVTITIFGCELQPTDSNKILSWIGPHSSGEVSPSTVEFYYPVLGARGSSEKEVEFQLKTPIAGTIKDLKVTGGTNSADADQLVGFRKNGVDTALTAIIDHTGPSSFILTNTTDTVTLAEGDEFNLFSRPDPGATIAPRDLGWYATLESDNSAGNGAFILATGDAPTGVVITPALVYLAIAGEAVYDTTESVAQAPVLFNTRFYGLILRTSATHTGTATVTLRRNGQDTNIKIDITADGQNTYQIPADWFENFDDGDLINYKVDVLTGTPRIQNIIIAGAAIGTISTIVVDLDSYLQKQLQLTTDLSAYTQKEGFEQISIDGLLTKIQQITTEADSNLTKQISEFTQLESYVNQLQSVSNSLDALIISTETQQEFVSLDALLTIQNLISNQLDSLLTKSLFSVVDLDSEIFKLQSLQSSIDGLVNKSIINTVALDSLIEISSAFQIALDSLLSVRQLVTLDVDSYINRLKTLSNSLDALVISTVAGEEFVDLDALITTQSIVATQLESLLFIAQSDVIDLDSYLTNQVSLLSNLSSLIQKSNSESTNLDSILGITRVVSSSIDAVLVSIVGNTVTTDLDGLVQKVKELSSNFDSLLGVSLIESVTLDSILKVRQQLDLSLSGVISKQLTEIVTLDSVVQSSELITTELNSYLFVKNSVNSEIDAILGLEQFINVLLECIIQKEQLISTTFNAVLFDPAVEIIFSSEPDFKLNPGITFKVNRDV